MATKMNFAVQCFVSLLMAAALVATTMGNPGCPEELERVKDTCKNYQQQVMLTLREILDQQQSYEEEMKTKLAECEMRMERRTKALVAGTSTTSTTTSTTTMETTTAASTTTATPGVPQDIYFVTYGGGLSAFSLETNQVRKIVNSSDALLGITYDSLSNKLYWCNDGTIYRSSKDEIEVETLISTIQYGPMYDLAFDRISGNIYVVTGGGYILACRDGDELRFNCFIVLSNQGYAEGITLDETEGLMYWTNYLGDSIHKAGMDGSNPVTLLTALNWPMGLTIDFASRRLYWAEYSGNKIQSSDLDGRDIQLLIQLPTGSYPWGIAVLGSRVYWGNEGDHKLQSATKDGQDLQTLYTEGNTIRQIEAVPASDPPTNRTNDCEGIACSTICVLTPTSYRCLA